MTTRYVHGPGIDEPLVVEAGGQAYAVHADALGSVAALSDGSQTVVEASTYASFGRLSRSGGVAGNVYAYTGREWEPELGLYYYRARYYDPDAGRFLSRDPIGFAGGDLNRYAYVGGDPINGIDPRGLATLHDWPANYLERAAGHVSLSLDDGTYISYWPTSRKDALDTDAIFPNSLARDTLASEKVPITFEITDLDEPAISAWWDTVRQERCRVLSRHCSDVVSEALRVGGFPIFAEGGVLGISTPGQVVENLQWRQRGREWQRLMRRLERDTGLATRTW